MSIVKTNILKSSNIFMAEGENQNKWMMSFQH